MNQPINIPDLFGDSSSPTLESLGFQPQSLAFNQSVDRIFEPIGGRGVPDPLASPMQCYQYLVNRRNVIQMAANQKPLIRLADANLNVLTELGQERSCTFEEMMADAGQLKCVIRYGHWLEDYMINGISINQDLHILVDPIPTYPTVDGIPQDWQIRWGGKCKEISITNDPDGTSSIEITAVSHREHPKFLLFGSSVWFPPEIQPDKMWILPGPLRSILFLTGFINLARLFMPGLSFITNPVNPAAWLNPLNPDALLNANPLAWPIQVAFVDPALDNSMWSVLAATWTDWHSTMADLLSNAGCICRAYTWLTTDATSPHTELTQMITAGGSMLSEVANNLGLSGVSDLINVVDGAPENLARPTRNCVVLSFEDKSGINGPGGTAVDGLLETVGVTLDDMITTVIFDQNNEQFVNGEEVIDVNQITPLFQSLLGVETTLPKVVWRDGQFSGLVRREVNMHKAPPKTMMTGGRSPTLVNELQTFGIRYALAELSMVPTLSAGETWGGPATFNQQVPATPGLENIYQGQLDNILLAWERYTDPLRALWTGDVAYQEYMERGTTSAYTLAGWLALSEAHWKTRPFYGFQAIYQNGLPWVYGLDFAVGDRVGFEMDGIIFIDQLAAVKFTYDRKQAIYCNISVGDDRDKHDPVAGGLRMLQGMYSLMGAFLGEGTLFG